MSILKNIHTAFGALIGVATEGRAHSFGALFSSEAGLYGGENLAGIDITQGKALELSPYWGAIDIISGDIAKLPFITYKADGDGREVAKTAPAMRLLTRIPNEQMTPFTFKKALAADAIQGNGYAFVGRDGSGAPSTLIKLSRFSTTPTWITDKKTNKRELWYVTTLETGKQVWMRSDEVIHIKGLSDDGIIGRSVLDSARQSLGLAYSAQGFGAKFFANNGSGGVIIQVPAKMSKDARDNLKNSWNAQHASMTNSHRTAVLEEGVKIEQFKMNAADAQLLTTREFAIVDIANWFRIPAHKLGSASRTSYSSLESENQSYLDTCLDPWLVAFEEEFMRKLLTPAQMKSGNVLIEADRSVLLRADSKTRMENDVKAVNNGLMTRNEIRMRRNLNPIDGLDEITIPLNLAAVGDEPEETTPEEPAEETPAEEPPADDQGADEDRAEANRVMLRATFSRVVKRWSSMYVKTMSSDKHDDPAHTHRKDIARSMETLALELDPYCRAAGVDRQEAQDDLIAIYGEYTRRSEGPHETAGLMIENVAQETIEKLGV